MVLCAICLCLFFADELTLLTDDDRLTKLLRLWLVSLHIDTFSLVCLVGQKGPTSDITVSYFKWFVRRLRHVVVLLNSVWVDFLNYDWIFHRLKFLDKFIDLGGIINFVISLQNYTLTIEVRLVLRLLLLLLLKYSLHPELFFDCLVYDSSSFLQQLYASHKVVVFKVTASFRILVLAVDDWRL